MDWFCHIWPTCCMLHRDISSAKDVCRSRHASTTSQKKGRGTRGKDATFDAGGPDLRQILCRLTSSQCWVISLACSVLIATGQPSTYVSSRLTAGDKYFVFPSQGGMRGPRPDTSNPRGEEHGRECCMCLRSYVCVYPNGPSDTCRAFVVATASHIHKRRNGHRWKASEA